MAKIKPIFDIAIQTAGRFDCLEKCINSIYNTVTFPVSITIVDDGTDKEERKHYKHLFEYNPDKDVHKLITSYTSKRHEINEGFVKTANDGAKVGSAPIIVFISDDIELHEGCLENIRKVMDDNKDVGICGAKLIFPQDSVGKTRPAGKIQHVGVALGIRGNAIHPLIGWSVDNPRTHISREVLAVTGALYTIRRELFQKCGGFDTIYGKGYWEDIDLCLKVRQLGYKIWLENSATAYHYTSATSEKNKTFGSQFQQNEMIFKSRWAKSGLLVWDEFTY